MTSESVETYKPVPASVESVYVQNSDIRTLRLTFPGGSHSWSFVPGQFGMFSVPGIGEAPLSMSSCPSYRKHWEITVRNVGNLTGAIFRLRKGDRLWARGPYGNGFPLDDWKDKNIVTIGGGIGQAPLRPIIQYILDNRTHFGKLDIIYGARSSRDLCFKDELLALEENGSTSVHLSIDAEEEGWNRYVGFVPNNLLEIKPSPDNSIAITCGPVVMIKYVIKSL